MALKGRCFIQTVGVSMEPLLHNRKSTVVIESKKSPLKRDDVVLYIRPSGEYVLHRIIKVLNGEYLIRGDNCTWKETVPEEWIIGVMVGFYADECNAYQSCNSKTYHRYLKMLRWRQRFWWMRNLFIRVKKRIF